MQAIRNAIKDMSAYVPGEKAAGDDYIILNANENPYEPSVKVIEAMTKVMQDIKWYPESSSVKVREAAAKIYNVKTEQVMFANSSDEMLRILNQACASEGDKIYAFTPSFTFYKTLAQVQGAEFCEIEFPDDFSLPQLPDLKDAKLLFFPNPGAPSGVVYSVDEMRNLIEAAPQALVVIDEAYADFDNNKNSVISLINEYDNLVVTRTFSKSYSLAGLRIGLGFASQKVMQELHKVRDYYNVDRIAQAGAEAALLDQETLKKNCDKIIATREWFVEKLEKFTDNIWPTATNFVLARFKDNKAAELYDKLKEDKILVRYWNKPRLNDCLRISIGTDEQMKIVLEKIKKYI